jgi:hypothetical protein
MHLTNQKLGLSGALFYENQYFGEVLDGTRSKVMNLWKKIQLDPCHRLVHLLNLEEVTQRNFFQPGLRNFFDKRASSKNAQVIGCVRWPTRA